MLSGKRLHGWSLWRDWTVRADTASVFWPYRAPSRGAIACSTRPRVRLKIALFNFERNQQKRLPVRRLF